MGSAIPMLAGAVSSVVFVCSTLPMLVKAARTRDLSSYSLGNILLSNLGNLIHAVYVFHLPAGGRQLAQSPGLAAAVQPS
jgi:hypothetical protein